MNKYFVSGSFDEFVILSEAKDEIGGNYYQTVKDGFKFEEDAKVVCTLMNSAYIQGLMDGHTF